MFFLMKRATMMGMTTELIIWAMVALSAKLA
jgi:hypothetical protein